MSPAGPLVRNDLPVLEVLDAAGEGLAPGRVEATGMLLVASGALGSNVVITPANGKPAESRELIEGLFEALARRRVRRYEGRYVLTSIGRRVLDEKDRRASAEARGLAAWASGLEPDALRVEVDRRLGG